MLNSQRESVYFVSISIIVLQVFNGFVQQLLVLTITVSNITGVIFGTSICINPSTSTSISISICSLSLL